MPHDANGDALKVGDIVTVTFEVTQVYGGETACNVSLKGLPETVEGEYPPTLTCNSRFTELRDPAG